MKLPIYMDNHATTPVDPRVLEAMLPYFTEFFGNAASRNHAFGWIAEEAVEQAREKLAHIIGAGGKELVFTSGATESNNLALKGLARMCREKGDHLITVATEHKSVLDSCRRLEGDGFRVTYLPVDRQGLVTAEQVRESLTERTLAVSVMAANNEIGVLQPLAEIGRVCRERGVLFHTDATQAVGKIPIDVDRMCVDLLSFSAHKLYGPKGVGALYVRRGKPRVRLEPLIDGGGHERGLRSGTLNVPGIVGFARAVELCEQEMAAESARLAGLRDRLWRGLSSQLDHLELNGHPTLRLPGHLNLSFGSVEGDALLAGLADLAVSSGSACTSASLEPSHVLRALGIGQELAHSSIRFGLGRFNTSEEVDHVIGQVVTTVRRLREISPPNETARVRAERGTSERAGH